MYIIFNIYPPECREEFQQLIIKIGKNSSPLDWGIIRGVATAVLVQHGKGHLFGSGKGHISKDFIEWMCAHHPFIHLVFVPAGIFC